jgi:hypothetical protein
VAPLDRRAQGLLPRQRCPAAARQQPQPVVQPRRHLLGRQRRHPRRRQLDRQRDAVQPPADLRHRRRVLGGEGEVRPGRGRALTKNWTAS